MSAWVVRGHPHAEVLTLWARLALSAGAVMAVGTVLCALPLLEAPTPPALEDAVAATGNAFSAFIIAELLCLPFGTWFGERRSRRLARPIAVALGFLATIAGMSARSAAVRTIWYALAGIGAETARAWIMGGAVRSPLLPRRPELLVLVTTCLAVVALALVLYVAAEGPAQGLHTLLVCSAGQATVIVLAVVYTLWPPAPSSFPIA